MKRIHELVPSGEKTALIDHDGTEWSFDQLRAESAALAALYREAGLRAGDRLIVSAENSRYYVLALLAGSQLDAWVTLVNARQTGEELDALIAHSGARMVTFTISASADARAHAERLGARQIGTVADEPVMVTEADPDATSEPVLEGADQTAVLMYTTGTTSAPKGVMLSHANLMAVSERIIEASDLRTDDELLLVLPGTHIYALGSLLLPMLRLGGRLRLMAAFDPAAIVPHLRATTTIFPGVPQMHAGILMYLAKTGQEFGTSPLRRLPSGGAPLDPALQERALAVFGVPISNGYGLTETAPTVTVNDPNNPARDTAVGKPLRDIDLRLDAPNDEGVGELLIRGPVVMKGYYRDPERTAEVFTEDGFFRSGDLARFGDEGQVYIVGRIKELIIRSGFNVYPPEVEAMLTKHPGIDQAAVVGRMVTGNEEICAFVIGSAEIDPEEVRDWLHQHLSGYKIPQHVVQVEAYPAAATGKILKHKLVEHFADRLPPVPA